MKAICALFGLAIIFASCNGGGLLFGPGKATGIVKDETTDDPIGNAQVILYEEDAEFLGSSTYNKLGETYSDMNGEFFFDFDHDAGMRYFVYVTHPDYWRTHLNFILMTRMEKLTWRPY